MEWALIHKDELGKLWEISRRIGLFEKFNDKIFFNDYKIVDGILTWDNGNIDISPESIYHIATGEPYPSWLNVTSEEIEFEKKASVVLNVWR